MNKRAALAVLGLLFSTLAFAGSTEVSVLSYNVHGLPQPIVKNFGQFWEIGRILKKRMAEGTAPQIVVLQEAFDRGAHRIISESGYPYVKKGPNGDRTHLSSGLYILSVFPIIETHSMVYSRCVSWDCASRKGAVHVRVADPEAPMPLDFFNLHLNSDPDQDPFTGVGKTRSVRKSQIGELVDFMNRLVTPGVPVFVPGDFNVLYGDSNYRDLREKSGLSDGTEYCERTRSCTGDPDPGSDFKDSVDHEFYSSATTGSNGTVRIEPIHFERNFKERLDGQALSDHFGLELHYRVSW